MAEINRLETAARSGPVFPGAPSFRDMLNCINGGCSLGETQGLAMMLAPDYPALSQHLFVFADELMRQGAA